MRAFVRYALDALFPRRCAVCRRAVPANESGAICGMCWAAIARIEGPQCPVCGSPFRSDAALSHSPTHRCGACRETPPSFTQAVSAGLYDGVLAEAIRGCKYRSLVKLIPALRPLWPDALQRIRWTDSQITLDRAQRRSNVRGAFRVRRPRQVAGRRVILVDDVYTTGATANECARVLRGAGAEEVYVVTLARMV